MGGKEVNFGDGKINKSNFYKSKKLFKIEDIDVNKILVSKKEPYGSKDSQKYLIGYNDDYVITPLCTKLHQMIGYVKYFNNNDKKMTFMVNDNKLLRKHTKIWEKKGA